MAENSGLTRKRAPRKRKTAAVIIARWKTATTRKSQPCATPDVARSVIAALLRDPTVEAAEAYYNDGRGRIDGFDRRKTG